MSSSDNYRGISLYNSLCKLLDDIFSELNAGGLKTDSMQIAHLNSYGRDTGWFGFDCFIANNYKM